MTRQLISNTSNHLLRSSHAQRPPQSGIVQVPLWEVISALGIDSGRIAGHSEVVPMQAFGL